MTVTHDGVDALRRAREFQPNIVILNLNMPLMNGIDTAGGYVGCQECGKSACLRSRDAEPTPTAVRHVRPGSMQHLIKPVDPAMLLGLLRVAHSS